MSEHNRPLSEPAAPEIDAATPPGKLAGDWTDDDPTALEEYFEPAPSGPIDWGDHLQTADPSIPQTTRIITYTVTVTGDGTNIPDPVMVLPADPNRFRLYVICTTVFGWQWGSTRSDVYGAPQFAGNGSTTGYDLSGHTGPLWIRNPSAATNNPLVIKVWAVAS